MCFGRLHWVLSDLEYTRLQDLLLVSLEARIIVQPFPRTHCWKCTTLSTTNPPYRRTNKTTKAKNSFSVPPLSLQPREVESPGNRHILHNENTATAQMPADPSSPLLELPREIRDMIYKNLLIQDGPIIIHACDTDFSNYRTRRKLRFSGQAARPKPSKNAILMANKQISLEAIAISYQHNNFRVGNEYGHDCSLLALRQFLHQAPSAGVKLISKVQLLIMFEDDRRQDHQWPPIGIPRTMCVQNTDQFHHVCQLLQDKFKGLRSLTIITYDCASRRLDWTCPRCFRYKDGVPLDLSVPSGSNSGHDY